MSALARGSADGRLLSGRRPAGTGMLDRVGLLYLAFSVTFLVASPFILGSQEQELNDPTLFLTSGQGDSLKQASLLLIYAVGGLLLLVRFPLRLMLFLGLPLVLLLALCVASIAWSVDPEGTVRRLVALLGTVLVGLFAGLRLDYRGLLRLMTTVAALVLVASLALAVVMPQAGLDPEGRLRGVFFHKNYLASFAALTVITVGLRLLCGMDRGSLMRTALVMLIGLAVLSIALSRSAAPVPALVAGLGIMATVHVARASDGRLRAVLPILLAVGTVGAATVVLIFGAALFGRSDDLSGRTEVWSFALDMIDRRLWLGYGYGVFWLGANSPGADFWNATQNFVPHAHNGFLQLALDAGVLGVGFWLASLVTLGAKAGMVLRLSRDAALLWVFGFLGFYVVINIAEANAWGGNDLHTLLLVFAVVRANVEYVRWRSARRPFFAPRRTAAA